MIAYDQEFFAAIGWHTVAWSFLENGIEFLVIAIHDLGGSDLEREPPWSLERKIKYLRRCFRRIAILEPYRDQTLEWLEKTKIASETRHDIIHGTLTEYNSEMVKLIRLLRTKTALREMKPINLTTKDIYESAAMAQTIAGELLTIANKVFDIWLAKESN